MVSSMSLWLRALSRSRWGTRSLHRQLHPRCHERGANQGQGWFPFRSYLYASDLTIWLWTILFKGEACHPYNVGSDQEITIAELAAEVAQHFRVPLINSNRTEIVMPANYVPDISRSMRQLGLNILIARNDSVNKTAAWATSLTA